MIAVRALLACSIGLFAFNTGLWAQSDAARAETARIEGTAQVRPELRAELPNARPAGRGLLRFWGFEVYWGSLWVTPGFRQSELGNHGMALELEYLRRFGDQEIARVTLEQMRRTGGFTDAQGEQWERTLRDLLPEVKPGDRLMGIYKPGVGVSFLYNGKPIGEMRDAQFARLFFGIWLAPNTSEPGLRQLLLAGTPP